MAWNITFPVHCSSSSSSSSSSSILEPGRILVVVVVVFRANVLIITSVLMTIDSSKNR